MGEKGPWWQEYVIPGMLAITLAFSGWSVTQHIIVSSHDQEQQIILSNNAARIAAIEQHIVMLQGVLEHQAAVEAKQQIVFSELERMRTRLERLEARR